jgi:hypothetical protein
LRLFGCRAWGQGVGSAVAGSIVGVVCTVAAIVITGGAVAQSGRTSAAVWVYVVRGAVAGGGCMWGGESMVKEERVGACLVCTSALLQVSSSTEKLSAGGSALPKKVQG